MSIIKKTSCISLCIFGIFGIAQTSFATEAEQLTQAMRQLDSVKAALLRAKTAANLESTQIQKRAVFLYPQALDDVATMKKAISDYLNPNRIQPRNPQQYKTLSVDLTYIKK
ncbi:hypothetical protein A6A19_07775 [Actinobacillus delphinicola]|uniref:Integrative conjugative element protein, RAQPRD family n=1 Tax=Actinobacillus delphinicola TaxID=51161 RepID=A0A448TU01_9PAST|nr:RAQPRD family integrative conjugative element protein [Actinobacillus delphinicola]MDG6897872.1 hypothetical protein [Actinobacillus delphinicola]VEJ09385.1 integrative conjugative element protein, RAQPRD family [Actinobacillus delphinicola]